MEPNVQKLVTGHHGTGPLAIVGYACRLPGHVSSPADLWELCKASRTGWSKVPEERFSQDRYWHPDPSKLGAFNCKGGYFLSQDIAKFDAQFFHLTAAEATAMDPQQRILLETAFEALESAGLTLEKVAKTDMGVFIGGTNVDYDLNGGRDLETAPMFHSTGVAGALLSNRISFAFDLRGPSTTYDTACSSSLVALHHAALSIRSGECSSALVGGSHLNLHPDSFVGMSLSQLFSEEGVTYAFDQRGQSGFARGEGAGCVVIKPLEAALRDGDAIRALLMSSGVNQDGRTKGITVPSGQAQRDLIVSVYEKAGLSPFDCGYAEMHGTGTKVGDPIEAAAVHEALARGRPRQDPLYIGSVKSNIGHLEGASGIPSLIKAAMILEKGSILPTANFQEPKEDIPLEEWRMKVATEVADFPSDKKFVSVSNYGFGGANAHVVLAKAPAALDQPGTNSDVDLPSNDANGKLTVLSAADQQSLDARVKDLASFLQSNATVDFCNLAYTLAERRSHLPSRLALMADSTETLRKALAQASASAGRALGDPKIAFVFTGQGAQWPAMGAGLLGKFPVFSDAVERADQKLRDIGADFSLLEELQKGSEESRVHEALISQSLCTSLQIALVDLLSSWNIRPNAVIGHSSGEIGCAYAAGIIDADSAMEIAYFRGQAMQLFKTRFSTMTGAMLAVGAGQDVVRPIISKPKTGCAVIACINSPSSVTVSGDVEAIVELESTLLELKIFNRRLKVDMAYHSPHMEKVAEDYRAQISHLIPATTHAVAFYSSVLGRLAQPHDLTNDYWVKNLVSPVRFSDALSAMYVAGDLAGPKPDLLVELGPHPALKGPIRDTLQSIEHASSAIYSGSLARNESDSSSVLRLAGALFCRGVSVKLESINFPVAGYKNLRIVTDLPTYPWNHTTRYWHESRVNRNHLFSRFARNDLLGSLTDFSSSIEPVWRNVVRLDELPWLRHHQMQGVTVFPMAGFIVLGIEAASQRAQLRDVEFDEFEIREFVINQALVLNEGEDVEITTSLRSFVNASRRANNTWDELTICSYKSGQGWVEHVRALITVRNGKQTNNEVQEIAASILSSSFHEFMNSVEHEAVEEVNVSNMYGTLQQIGAGYGPTFQGLENASASDHCAFSTLVAPNTRQTMPLEYETDLIIHPAPLDVLLQTCWPIFGAGRRDMHMLYMPTSIGQMTISRNVPLRQPRDSLRIWVRGSPDLAAPKPTSFDLFASSPDQTQRPCLHLENVIMTPVIGSIPVNPVAKTSICFRFDWEEVNKVKNKTETADEEGKAQVDGTSASASLNVQQELAVAAFTDKDEPLAEEIAVFISELTGGVVSHGKLDVTDVDRRVVIVIGLSDSSIAEMNAETLGVLQNLFMGANCTIWVHPAGSENIDVPEASMIVGLTRTIRSETGINIVTLGLEAGSISGHEASDAITQVLRMVCSQDDGPYKDDREFVKRRGKLCVPRVVSDDRLNQVVHKELGGLSLQEQPYDQPGRRFKIAIERPGALDSLYFTDDTVCLADDEIEIEVKATGVNFKDIVVSMGQLQQPYIGLEVAGFVHAIGKDVVNAPVSVGQRVMALVEGGFCTVARCRPSSVCPIPDNLSFESACSIPVVYCTAHYSLFELGRLGKGDTVLIHAAAGGVGQAAIQLAKLVGATVFATVGSKSKKEELMDRFDIPGDHIFYSRDISFATALRRATNGQGVDVIINSLAGDLLRETWDCLAPFGRFIEIGKTDITRNSRLDMKQFENNISFSSVDLSKVAAKRPNLMRRLLDDVCKLLANGSIEPVTPKVYSIDRIEEAFRALQAGKSTGKLVIVPAAGATVRASLERTSPNLLHKDATYLVIGGTGGIGCSMAKWMLDKGARNIVLTSRSAKVTPEVRSVLEHAKTWGANVVLKANDVTDSNAVSRLIKEEMKHLPPIRGVINAAMVVQDELFEHMPHDKWEPVTGCKVRGTWNMHYALAESPLDFFVCLGSCVGIIGNRGQSAYASANVFLDHFVQWRNSQGLPGTCLDLAAVWGVGYLAREKDRQQEVLRTIGAEPITEREVLAILAAAICGETESSCDSVCITGLSLSHTSQSTVLSTDKKFQRILQAAAVDNGAAAGKSKDDREISNALKGADPKVALEIILEALAAKLFRMAGLKPEETGQSPSQLLTGLDSLVAVEFRTWIQRSTDALLTILEIQGAGTIEALAEKICEKSSLIKKVHK